ncbi:hypothetical protein B0H12DRAFT_1070511 [Mycena haematopus]|nr:hypothetical protein B0H12DRAFT_1070511 [Mycena haematopus]
MDDVPAEVWTEIFRVNTLERSHFISLHRVSRSLHRISRPLALLFKHFAFHPYAVPGSRLTDNFLIPGEVEIKRTIRRLRFWASDDVAPLVRECTVSPCDIEDEGRERYVSCSDGDMLLCAFFELLPRFATLGKLEFFYVKFNLKEIELGKFSVDEAVTTDLHLKAAKISFSHEEDVLGVQRWLSIIDRQMLTHLSLSPFRPAMAFLNIDTALFPNVETPEICIYSLADDIMALHRFPAVRTLHLSVYYPRNFPIPARSLFPILDTFCGPLELLILLDSRATPQRLQIDNCGSRQALEIMQSCPHTLRCGSATCLARRLPIPRASSI